MRNDNRDYNYTDIPSEKRGEYEKVTDLLPSNAKVVDLACGNGVLMQMMVAEKNCLVEGIEISPSGVTICQERGLKVQQGRIDTKMPFHDDQFDAAVCNVTIQMVMYPEVLVSEMKRIAKKQIISFPNFAYWRNRLDMVLMGRMPKRMLFGYKWYNTGHIHQLSISDFKDLLEDVGGLKITNVRYVPVGMKIIDSLGNIFPGLFRKTVIIETERT
ncbi:methionine biosynthesis protein MetW [Chitinophaga sp. Hz27]|uniref:methionine biosynthesis protein MetW n=1 Tax=Chitinophaga sp. Hz27 TaxID=3347169 RepID=UPI0035D57964